MKKTSHSLDEEAARAIEALSKRLKVSRAEVVRRCTVAMHRANKLPDMVADGYKQRLDGRTGRDVVGQKGSLGRAPSMGNLSSGDGAEDSGVELEQSAESSPEGDRRGSKDSDGESKSFLDKRIL